VTDTTGKPTPAAVTLPSTAWLDHIRQRQFDAALHRATVRKSDSIPLDVQQAITADGLDAGAAFGPGVPLEPYAGVGGEPRAWDYQAGYNIVTRPQRDKRVSFSTLKAIIDTYDVARMAISHRIDDVRSLNWSIVPKRGFSGDAENAVETGHAIMARPEGPGTVMPFRPWLAKWLEDVLRYDAGCLFRRRDYTGQVCGLEVVSGTTIAPMLDYWGRTPNAPAPAYTQFVHGVPWKWYSTADLIYIPFRPQPDSPYGFAPLEAILLTANTDIRFQNHFLSWFTAGTVPEGFATAPEDISSPDQLREWQEYWDALLYGDDAAKHQIKFMPHGTIFEWPRDKKFDKDFSLYLMRKVAAAYHVTPNDLGFTEDVNRATGDTQVDVQFRVGTLPLVQYVEEILTDYLQQDRGLPVEFKFDTGQEKEDRLAVAQAHQLYVDMGAESPDEVRAEELGLPIDNERPVPRFFNSSRQGVIPLASLYAVAGAVDPETAAPSEAVPLNEQPFTGTPGLFPDKLPGVPEFKRAPINPDEPERPELEHPVPGTDTIVPQPVAKAAADERAAFARFVKGRRKAGTWRDFQFTTVDQAAAARLNAAGRAEVRKAAGQLVAAGLAVRAADTGRVLMLQRGYDPTDDARGLWEFPGGHIEDGESPFAAAVREWQEETGCLLPADALINASHTSWAAGNGIYVGYVLDLASEACVDLRERGQVVNPDDPDGDVVEAIAWWDPALLTGNPAMRAELAADMDRVLPAINPPAAAVEVVEVGKAAWRDHPPATPHAEYDLVITDHYAPLIADAMQDLWTDDQIHSAIETMAGDTVVKGAGPAPLPKPNDQALRDLIRSLVLDALAAGDHAAGRQLGPDPILHVSDIDWSAWKPGDPRAAELVANGGLKDLLDGDGIRLKGINDTTLERIGNKIADGLAAGDSVDAIARGIRSSVLGDAFRATMIAHTEMARAMTDASLSTYALNGIRQWNLLTTGGACALCLAVEARNPHDVADKTDSTPPLHPLCRCAVSPVVTF